MRMTFAALLALATCFAMRVQAAESLPYKWRAELDGPMRACRVPARILFVVADAIIAGKVSFGGKVYFPRGRIEDSLATELKLVRFYDDPRPLVKLTGVANGKWNGVWTSPRPGCSGRARIAARP